MFKLKKAIISMLVILTVSLFTVACNDSNSVETSNTNTESTSTSTETSTEITELTSTESSADNTEPPINNIEYDETSLINIVRNGSLYQYPDIPLKKAFNLFIADIEWDTLIDETRFYVSVSGNITVYDEEAVVVIVYEIDPENELFRFNSIYLDGTEETEFFYKLLEYKVMDLYIYGDESIENYLINFVKNGTLFDYENIPLGFAIENWFGSPTWEAILADDDNYYININGTVTQYGEYVDATLQYLVDLDSETFLFNALEIDGIPQTEDVYSTMITDMMENITNYLPFTQA